MDQNTDTGVLDIKKKESSASKSLTQVSYSTTTARLYAVEHVMDESGNTSIFSLNSENCQNFASQCVWAGLGGTGNDPKAEPAVSIANLGTSNSLHLWCHNEVSTAYSSYKLNWTWDNINGFMKLIDESSSSNSGPFGYTFYSNGITRAKAGCVIGLDKGGAPAELAMDHAMFVTRVFGTYGQRSMDEVKIAAHNDATNTAYESISTYLAQYSSSYDNDNCGRSIILSGYY